MGYLRLKEKNNSSINYWILIRYLEMMLKLSMTRWCDLFKKVSLFKDSLKMMNSIRIWLKDLNKEIKCDSSKINLMRFLLMKSKLNVIKLMMRVIALHQIPLNFMERLLEKWNTKLIWNLKTGDCQMIVISLNQA